MNRPLKVLSTVGTAALIVAVPVVGVASSAAAAPVATTASTSATSGGTQELSNENAAENGVTVVAPSQLAAVQKAVNYSVSIKSMPSTARAGSQTYLTGTSTGFSDGNWVNAWITGPDGVQRDAGGNWVKAGKFTLPVTFPAAGKYTVQLSLGAYPEEQYSQKVSVDVKAKAYNTKPVAMEVGINGKRYLQVSGESSQKPGSTVYVFITRPGHFFPTMVGTATVQADGSYVMKTSNSAAELNKDGLYWINASTRNDPFSSMGISTYYNDAY